jgi:hypothetical protein
MRLLVESEFKPAGGIIGAGFDGCAGRGRCGGDELRVESEILEVRLEVASNQGWTSCA